MCDLIPFPNTTALGTTLLGIARRLPTTLPLPKVIQPPAHQPGVAIRLAEPTPLRTAMTRATLGRFNGLRPEDPAWPTDTFCWIDATGAPVPGKVTTHDLLAIGVVHFPDGPVAVPGAWELSAPRPLDDGESGPSPIRLHTLLRLAASCRDWRGLDDLLQPETASILVVDADMIASTAWALTHVARITRLRPGGRGDQPLRLLVLRGGAGDAAALAQAFAEKARLVVLTPNESLDWPEGLPPPTRVRMVPADRALISRQIDAMWPGVPWGKDDPQALDPLELPDMDWIFERELPTDESLARLTAADIAAALAESSPANALHALNRRVLAA